MSWFQRHLHWTAVLTVAAVWPIAYLVGAFFGAVAPSIAYSEDALSALGAITGIGVVGIGWAWVLREKGRSAAWLLLALFVPLGFLCIFLLENRNPRAQFIQSDVLPATPMAQSSSEPTGDVLDRLPIEYCEKCGAPLEVRKVDRRGFDRTTGLPLYDAILACPEAVFYETDMGGSRVSWRLGSGGHTVIRRLVISSQDAVTPDYAD